MLKKKEVCIELRQNSVNAHKNASDNKSIAKWFDISKSIVQSIIHKF